MMQVCSENRQWEVAMSSFCGSSFLRPMLTARLCIQEGKKRRTGSSSERSLEGAQVPFKAFEKRAEGGVA